MTAHPYHRGPAVSLSFGDLPYTLSVIGLSRDDLGQNGALRSVLERARGRLPIGVREPSVRLIVWPQKWPEPVKRAAWTV